MSQQKNSILINEHALNCEPIPLNITITLFEPSCSLNCTINLPTFINLIILGDNLDKTTIIKHLEACKYIFLPLNFFFSNPQSCFYAVDPPPPLPLPPPPKKCFKMLVLHIMADREIQSLFKRALWRTISITKNNVQRGGKTWKT